MNEDIKFNVGCLKSHKFNFDYCLDELLNNFDYLQKQLEVYKNVIKEAIKLIDYYGITPEQNDNVTLRHILKDLSNILNKVGSDK